jgi:NTE family protein
MKLKKNSKIGLALGGGAVLGAVHIGVIKALEENSITTECISGTSIGALIASLFACGLDSASIEKSLSKQGWFDISNISLSKMGILSNEKLGKFIDKHVGSKNFDETQIPLAIVASDLIKGEKVILKEGKIANAVMASTCIPGIFTPVTINGRVLVDGGITENLPITPLKDFNCETIVGIDLTNVKNIEPNNIFDVLINAFNIAQHNTAKLQQVDADIVITPDLSQFNYVDTRQIPDLISLGYEEALNIIE